MMNRRLLLAAAAAALIAPATALAAEPAVYQGFRSRLALDGHDAVAYFTKGAPAKGKAQFTTSYNGATWRFASAENLAAFQADPGRYAPQYGGYCAWAVANGYTAKGAPNAWKIVDGKLYLNYNKAVQRDWEHAIPQNIKKANAHWPAVLNK